MDANLRDEKLAKLVKSVGAESFEHMAWTALSNDNYPAICINKGCDYTCEMEPDQDAGWCECCDTNTVVGALALGELI
jgi:hypothetical protein